MRTKIKRRIAILTSHNNLIIYVWMIYTTMDWKIVFSSNWYALCFIDFDKVLKRGLCASTSIPSITMAIQILLTDPDAEMWSASQFISEQSIQCVRFSPIYFYLYQHFFCFEFYGKHIYFACSKWKISCAIGSTHSIHDSILCLCVYTDSFLLLCFVFSWTLFLSFFFVTHIHADESVWAHSWNKILAIVISPTQPNETMSTHAHTRTHAVIHWMKSEREIGC